MALYNGHGVAEISRNDASGENLHRTTQTISEVIADARKNSYKAACFVTGVPGAGKTLIGLNIATQHFDKEVGLHSVFLSGNGPLVKILQEALALDKVERDIQFTGIQVNAELVIPEGADADRAQKLLEKAEATCFITNSLKAEPHLEASISHG